MLGAALLLSLLSHLWLDAVPVPVLRDTRFRDPLPGGVLGGYAGEVVQAEAAPQHRHVAAGERLGTSGIANGSWHLHLGLLLDGEVEQDDWAYILREDEIRAVLGGYKNGQRL